jgi:hypothetical protein
LHCIVWQLYDAKIVIDKKSTKVSIIEESTVLYS